MIVECCKDECEYNAQLNSALPDSMKRPRGVKANKPTNASLVRAANDEELTSFLVGIVMITKIN